MGCRLRGKLECKSEVNRAISQSVNRGISQSVSQGVSRREVSWGISWDGRVSWEKSQGVKGGRKLRVSQDISECVSKKGT